MAATETDEQRLARVPLDRAPARDWVRRWTWGLSLGLPVLAVAAFALGHFRGDGGTTLTTPRAPVSSVHATWDANCTACHEPFTPIRGASWTAPLFGRGTVKNERCQSCHAGPVHHQTQREQQDCTACHREHRGRQASLVRIPDSDCTACHGNLAAHYTGPADKLAFRNVTDFSAAGHPEFRVFDREPHDPGRLRFNHRRHLTAGMVVDKDGQRPFTLGDLAPADRDRYARQQADRRPGAPVQLTCASCHVADAGDLGVDRSRLSGLPADALLPARRAGDTMMPITFENQCRACHPLTFEADRGKFRGDGVAVPHRLQPPAVRQFLEGFYTRQLLTDQPEAFQDLLAKRPLPGKLLDAPKAARVSALIDKQVQAAGTRLFSEQACGLCHLRAAAKDGQPDVFAQAILAPQVPECWLPHATFSHRAHRAVDCRQCHTRAATSEQAGDVLLPGVKTCLQCHGPQRVEAGVVTGGARFDCVQCHRYHHGDAPHQGRGAAARGVPAASMRDLKQFLDGR
jgi:hypothetical protein